MKLMQGKASGISQGISLYIHTYIDDTLVAVEPFSTLPNGKITLFCRMRGK